MNELSNEHFEAEAARRIRQGNLLEWPGTIVITIMTKGRAYGRISQAAEAAGVAIPTLAFHTAKLLGRHVFVCLWDDRGEYTPAGISACAAACIRAATLGGVRELALPMLGGSRARGLLWAAEKGIFQETERLEDEEGFTVPEHVYVTNRGDEGTESGPP